MMKEHSRFVRTRIGSGCALYLLPTIVLLVVLLFANQVVGQDEAIDSANNTFEGDNYTTWDDDVDEIDDFSNVTTVPGTIISRPISTKETDSILFPWFVELLGCCTIFILTRFQISIPYAAVMFILGALMGYGAVNNPNLNDETYVNKLVDSIIMWTNIDSATLLLIFLPGLIFKDAVEIPINLFLVAGVQIWILSFPMVLVGTALTGVAGKYCLPYDSQDPEVFGWWAWIVLGAILASTDPIAVSSVLKTAGASPRLVMHISGESLMNDGSSYVFFQIAAQLWYDSVGLPVQNDISTWGSAFAYFFRMSLGGILVGTVFGFALLGILWELDRRMEQEFDIVQVVVGLTVAYLCYYTCDQVLITSGVIATVACGIVVNRFGRGLIHDKDMMSSYLALADFLLNTLLFALGGTIWAVISFSTQESDSIGSQDWAYLFVFYILCMIIRFLQVGMFYPILSRIGLKSNWKEGVFLAYGGLHGSVGVALGLSLIQYVFEETTDRSIRDAATRLQFLGGGATLLTLTINGTTAGTVLKLLGLVKPPVSAEHIKHVFEGTAKDFVYNEMSKLFQERRFQYVSFDVLKEQVPFVNKQPPKIVATDDPNQNQSEAIQKFHQRVVGDGKPYISLLNATKHASQHASSQQPENQEYELELLVEMRQIFLELLQEAYKVKEELGELDQKHHNGYLYDVLMQSVDLSINEVRYDKKAIEDWKYTEMFFRWSEQRSESLRKLDDVHSSEKSLDAVDTSQIRRRIPRNSVGGPNERVSKARSSMASFTSSLVSVVSNDESDRHRQKTKTQVGVKRMELDVLRALAFIHAHKMAEAKLELYVNRFDDDLIETIQAKHSVTEDALETVLAESRDQVSIAEVMLRDEVCDRDLEIILSHYCAKILVRRLIMFTEKKFKEGFIGKEETRSYRRRMKDCIHKIETRTVELLTESRLNNDDPRQLGSKRMPSNMLESVCENSHGTGGACNEGDSSLRSFLEEGIDPPFFHLDISNDDTIGRSNVKIKSPLNSPLAKLFEAPSELSEPSIIETDEKGTDEKKSSKATTSNDGGTYASA